MSKKAWIEDMINRSKGPVTGKEEDVTWCYGSDAIIIDDDHTPSAYCYHEWINVGFHFDKWVCKKCDKDKTEKDE